MNGALNERGGFIDLFDRFAAVGFGDDEPIAVSNTIAQDFVTKPFAVSIEEPDHNGLDSIPASQWKLDDKPCCRCCSFADAPVV